MAWIVRLEDQRMLRDAAAPAAPAAPVVEKGKKAPIVPPPPPPPDLTRLLTDSEARVRRRAALAVGRAGLAEGAASLVPVLRSDTDPEVRQMAAFAIGLIGDKTQPPVMDALRLALADTSPVVSGRAAEAIGLVGDTTLAADVGRMVGTHVADVAALAPDESRYPLEPGAEAFRLGVYALVRLKAYEPLAAAVLGPDGQPRVQWWPVAYGFQRIGDKRALPALMTLARTNGAYTRAFAAKGLGALKDPSAVPALLPLVVATTPASGPTIEAIRALGEIGDARAAEPLLQVARTAAVPPTLRAEAIMAAVAAGADPSQDFVVDQLNDPSPTVRAAAMQAIAKGEDDTFLAILSGLDPDPHWSVRAELAKALATKDPARALPRLLQMLNDTDGRVIPSVLTALAKIKAPNLQPILLQQLSKDDAVIRAYAAEAMGETKPDGGADALIAAYKRGNADAFISARGAALTALSKYGAAAALPTLREALADKDWAIRVRAAELIAPLDPAVETAHAIRPAPPGRLLRYEVPSLLTPVVSPHIYFETDKGTVEIELDVLDAPLTCASFVDLVGKGYFEGLPLHRLVPDFVVQGGDPRGDGEGGPGYAIRDELNQTPYLRGTVGMALDWRDTGGSQFFITFSPQPHLDAKYTAFGKVVNGMDVVDKLTQWDTMRRVRVWDGSQN